VVRAGETVFLYLPEAGQRSKLGMRIADVRHQASVSTTLCPDEWETYCTEQVRAFGSGRSIHKWFLVSAIEELPEPIDLTQAFRPVFSDKYQTWGQNFFAFLRA
jgi:hypothetical protein